MQIALGPSFVLPLQAIDGEQHLGGGANVICRAVHLYFGMQPFQHFYRLFRVRNGVFVLAGKVDVNFGDRVKVDGGQDERKVQQSFRFRGARYVHGLVYFPGFRGSQARPERILVPFRQGSSVQPAVLDTFFVIQQFLVRHTEQRLQPPSQKFLVAERSFSFALSLSFRPSKETVERSA